MLTLVVVNGIGERGQRKAVEAIVSALGIDMSENKDYQDIYDP